MEDKDKNGQPEGNGGKESEQNKTFTQEDVNRIAAAEKRQGVSSALKDLGFTSAEEAKKAVEAWRKSENDKKDEMTKATEAKEQAEKGKAEAEKRVVLLERRMSVIESGADPKNAEDIVTLATAKIDDKTDFAAALEIVKKNYPSLFNNSQESGTGGSHNPPRKKSSEGESMGERLAKKRTSSSKENPYFK